MNERLTIQDLTDLLAAKHSMTKKDAEAFVKEFFLLIEEALENEKYVKIKGLGTFKLIEVDSRESVNVNTGERFQIKGHRKVSFTPDANLRDTINKPFAHFETVVLNDNTILEDTPMEEVDTDDEITEDISIQTAATIDNMQPAVPEEISTETIEENTSLEESATELEIPANISEKVIEPVTVNAAEQQVVILKEEKNNEISEKTVPQCSTKEKAIVGSSIINKNESIKKEESPTALLITVIATVIILCGGTILFVYYPDLFSPSSQEVLDTPTTTQSIQPEVKPTQPEVQLIDTITKAKMATEDMKEISQPAAKKESTEPISNTYSDSVTYTIIGTKATHTIKEGESLMKVSLKYYGTKALWQYIVKHNEEIIKNPDNVPYGTTIKIPELAKK